MFVFDLIILGGKVCDATIITFQFIFLNYHFTNTPFTSLTVMKNDQIKTSVIKLTPKKGMIPGKSANKYHSPIVPTSIVTVEIG